MIKMFKTLWSMLTIFFSAGEDLAYATKDITTYTREGAKAFTDEARLERAKALKQRQAELDEVE